MFARLVLVLAVLFAPLAAHAQATASPLLPAKCKFFNGVGAAADRDSVTTFGRAIDLASYRFLSVHLVWASLTGSIDATFKVQVSNDGTNWVDKTGASFTLSGASSSNVISLTNVTERFAKFVYAHGSVNGGTLTGYCTAKG